MKKMRKYSRMYKIVKKLFMLKNSRPLIDLLNSIYCDNISYEAEIEFSNEVDKNRGLISCYKMFADIFIKIKENSLKREYAIEFQLVQDNIIAMRIFKDSVENPLEKLEIRNLNKKTKINIPNTYTIVFEENSDIPEETEYEICIPGQKSIIYKTKVMHFWKYDLERLKKENLYLLYPLQLFIVANGLENIVASSENKESKETGIKAIYEQVKGIVKKSVDAIEEMHSDGKISTREHDEMNKAIFNIVHYYSQKYGEYDNIEEEVREMARTFYDAKVEKDGKKKAQVEIALKMLNDKVDDQYILKYTKLNKSKLKKIKEQ